jgi:NADH dehydrogenase
MIVVAGGTGFVGRAIARALARPGEQVAVLSHSVREPSIHAGDITFEVRRGDVTDQASLGAALQGVDTVVGAVQFKGFPNENPRKGLTFEQVDQHGTENLVAAAKQAGVRRYVYVSGAGAGPDAKQTWYRAKWGAETAVRGSGMEYLIVRPSWVYGPGDNALNKYVAFVKSPLPVVPVIGNGKQRLQPVFVEDVARLVAESLAGGDLPNADYEIGGPDVLSMDEVIRTVEEVLGRKKPLVHQPASLMKLLFSPKALIPALPLPLNPTGVEFATMDALADTSALLAAFPSFRLTPLREGLQTYLGTQERIPVG